MSARKPGRPVFDASAVLALLQGEPGSDKLAKLLAAAVIGSVNVAEVLAKLVARGMPPPGAEAVFGALHLEIATFDARLAGISANFVSPGISLGDRCFLATAQQHGTGWTSDRELASLAAVKPVNLQFFR